MTPYYTRISESLASRVAVLQLLGFSSWELADKADSAEPFSPPMMKYANAREPLGLNDLYEQIWRGDFPAIATNHQMDRDLFYGSYVQTYLQRDVKALVLTPSPYPPRGKTASFKWLFASTPRSEKPYLFYSFLFLSYLFSTLESHGGRREYKAIVTIKKDAFAHFLCRRTETGDRSACTRSEPVAARSA